MTPGTPPHGVLAETRPASRWLGLYIHVPFCVQRCHYCSFNTAPLGDEGAMARYLATLRCEIARLAALPWAHDVGLATVFFGGGTPSLVDPDDLAGILGALAAGFRLAPDAEVTVECNPESVSRARLEAYLASGVNRLSLGVQSLEDALLKHLGRLHDTRAARAAFDAAREAGCINVSVDLMYGLPGLDLSGWRRTVDTVLDWGPEHLSAYGLTLDAGSLWGAAGVDGLPPESVVVEQYWALARAAAARGFEHYEISNYARPGSRSRHNQIYWRGEEYLACGPGGAGFIGDVRYTNAKALARYCATLEAGALPIDGWERLSARQRVGERLILGLRTADGVPAAALAERLAQDPTLHGRVAAWYEAGLLRETRERVNLSEAGFLVSDTLFVELV